MYLRACVVVVASLGCGKKADAPAAASGSAAAVVPVDAVVAAAAIDASVADAPAVAANCLPESYGNIGRIGADLVACNTTQCWTIDPATGKVTPRAAARLPGVGFTVETASLKKPSCYEGLCWDAPKRDPDSGGDTMWVAYHPDGKRVAIIDDPDGMIFDLTTKKLITKFSSDLGNSLGGLWFAGNFVMNAGFDAGPYAVLVYHDPKTGKKLGTFEDFFGGSANITSTGTILVSGQDMTTVSVIDGTSYKGKITKRKIPKAPAGCEPQDPGMDTESEDPKQKACVAFANKHYTLYGGAALVELPGGGYLGFHRDELFTVDKNLVETAPRVKVAVCAPPPGDE
ncbi:MAG: hypothetical protein ABI867_42700 [Kofleriaceae bacterium]